MELKEIENIVEGILFAMGGTVEPSKIAKALEVENDIVIKAVESLKQQYEEDKRGITITEIDGSYQMCTSPDIYEYLIRIAKQPKKYVLTDVLLETLSIIAYKQPITKSEIEKIRGVSCDFAVSKLVEFGLCTELGRLDAPGRPMLFGTTEEFLRSFGVSSIEELPELSQAQIEEFKLEAESEADNVEVTV
ncbi:MAG: SMC-Scp complex subunit ScpB [Pseudobutyrivibrio sp.]|nr:SMC-Scp complex subunit ScpB [Pseudobutyrivibrio sp.]